MNQLTRVLDVTPGSALIPVSVNGPSIGFAQKRITLGGSIANRAEADELIATINALKGMLPEAPAVATAAAPVTEDDGRDLI